MANLKSDSPIARRIVLTFLDFLNSVEPAPGTDLEGLEVAKDCLTEVFKLDSSSVDDRIEPGFLVNTFSSLGVREHPEIKADLSHGATSVDAPSSSSLQTAADATLSKEPKSLGDDLSREPFASDVSKDELFGKFFAALEKIHFFKTTIDGKDDTEQLEKATRLFHDTLNEMERSGCQSLNLNNLADSLKSQGNRAMQSKLYSDAIELYSCAIALNENNAVYYCNRAAAYTQILKYTEAITDCLKSIEIDPNYSKAYSRLGLVYYAQGNYSDAINKGFKKALQLDPHNESVKENIRVAEQKLKEGHQHAEQDQSTSSASHNNQESGNQFTGGSRSRATPFSFTSMPFGTNGVPADIANMFMNMATNAYQGPNAENMSEQDNHVNGSNEPRVSMGGNVSFNFGEQMPEELTGALRSMMDMFSGAASQGNSQDSTNERSSPNQNH